MQDNYVSIQYIGKAPVKSDNILHVKSRIWYGPYSCVRIPLSEYEKYLAHPDEFQILLPMFLESPIAAMLSTDDQIYHMASIVSNLELHAAEEVLLALQARIEELTGPRGQVPISARDRPRFNDRRAAIVAAISQMDPTNPVHYTDSGRPRVAIVQELSQVRDVASAEVVEIVRQMARQQAAA